MTTLLPEVNFAQYMQRMDAASEKTRILDYIQPGTVLDYGSGSGVMAPYFRPDDYTGYDLAPQMVKAASETHPGYTFTTAIDHTQKFKNVLFSSLLHEVYSYQGYQFSEVVRVLEEVKPILDTNGIIVIRDGIQPKQVTNVSYKLRNPQNAQRFLTYLHRNSRLSFPIQIKNGHVQGLSCDVINFLNVYTWGWKSVDRELNERVNFATESQWRWMLEQAGYSVLRFDTIVQNEYFTHLNKLVDLRDASWETKVFIVARP